MKRVSELVRNQVKERATGRCEYCRLPEEVARLSHQVDHIVPPRHSGSNEPDNLAWACFRCNNNKGTDISTIDVETNQLVRLYNPRTQQWDEHFVIEDTGHIVGKTPQGRATARLLDMNNDNEVEVRGLLVRTGLW